MSHTRNRFLALALILVLLTSWLAVPAAAEPQAPVSFTILHTNDFHGQIESSAARVAQKVIDVRTAVGAENVLLMDAGDIMQGSLISNLQKGLPTIDYYRTIGYNAATFGNHEFDWGKTVLDERIAQAEAPATADESPMQMVAANITKKDGSGNCTWEPFNASVTPYQVFTVAGVRVGVIGVGSLETPTITIAGATEGLCFRDPKESILHYYDELDAASDVIVVLSHIGYTDGGYGYGISVTGDQTLAKDLNTAGKPVNLIIGGHTHTDLAAATVVGTTSIVQAYTGGAQVGRANVTYDPATSSVTIAWEKILTAGGAENPAIKALVDSYVNDPTYQAMINQAVGYTQVDLPRFRTERYAGEDNMMGDFVDDAISGWLNSDATTENDIDMWFNNAGGIRVDWCDKEDPANPGTYIWSNTLADCSQSGIWSHDPMLLKYGQMFQILPFGNVIIVGRMTGAQIADLLNQAATLYKGALQPSGIRYKFYRYSDALPGPQPYAWGAYDIEVYDKATSTWAALDVTKTYKVGTNEYLAPAGQDGFVPFKYMTNISYWGDMLNAVNEYVAQKYGTPATAYKGPNGDGTLDNRLARDGDGDNVYEAGEIVPVTLLHHNDSHGNLVKGTYVGYTQLATLIKQERVHNPDRTLLFSLGDNIQGDSMMYYFKNAAQGTAADGTPLPPTLWQNPFIAVMNAMSYNGMVLGNHEFNFGAPVFDSTFSQAAFPILGANVTDSGAYGINKVGLDATAMAQGVKVNVRDGLEYTLPSGNPANPEVKIGFLGLTNHRVPNYELPSNIPGLTFSNPIATAKALAPVLRERNDAVVALTHIGFTENAKSAEIDDNVDTNLAAVVPGIDAILGSHSHTDPSKQTDYSGAYKYLPAVVAGPENTPVLVNQAYRYNNTLGEVVIGLRAKTGGGYEVASRAGRYISVGSSVAEDAAIKAIVDPYVAALAAYNNTEIGQTTVPIDTLKAFTEETNGANLQADASVYVLEKSGVQVDFHLSGAMTNKKIADSATPASPYTLKILRYVLGHAVRKLAAGAEDERPAAQDSAGTRVP